MIRSPAIVHATLLALLAISTTPLYADVDRQSAIGQEIKHVIEQALHGEHRSAESRARDIHRRPLKTLAFWGFEPDMTVVEVWPGGGWYSEILAPALKDRGQLVVANFPLDATPQWRADSAKRFADKMAAKPEVYGSVQIVPFSPPEYVSFGESGSADMVVLSRHFHNFIRADIVDDVLAASRDVLKKEGVLAIVQHRALDDATPEWEKRTGYVREDWLVEKVESAGFQLEASSDLNHNPKDPREHEAGVWSLPPSLRACRSVEESQRSRCLDTYENIGESDRMTLRFRRL